MTRKKAGLGVFTRIPLLLVIALSLTGTACAVGISIPMEYKWDFSPNFEKEIGYHVYNSFAHPQRVIMTLSGPLAQYGTVTPDDFEIGSRGVESIVVTLKLPADIPSGEQKLYITATEAAPKGATGMSGVSAVRVFMQVTKPYVGKYLKATMEIPSTIENETLRPTINVENLGTENVPDAYARIVFHDAQTNLSVGTSDTDHAPVNFHDSAILRSEWPNTLKPGLYEGTATVYGGDTIAETTAKFTVGELEVDLVAVNDTFVTGQVNPVDFILMNRWNAMIMGVKTTIWIGDNTTYWRAAGPDLLLYPWQETHGQYFVVIPAGARPGTYPGYVEITFAGKTKQYPKTFTVTAGAAVGVAELQAPAKPVVNTVRLLFVLMFAVILFLYLRRRKKEQVGR